GFAALYIAHGVTRATTVALIGTFASVGLITALAVMFTALANLTGLSDESFQLLRVTASSLDPRGVLVAGIVIGALGVLDDVTVTQVSAVNELRAANPEMTGRDTYRAAVRIGRDHVASTVNTLVLAYVGAALALLLFFFQEGRAVAQVLNREVVAVEISRALIGSIGLIIAVPVTTALAVAVLVRANDTP
ncbi:MAG TPA: YibE/F family protein, partial [Acidimicrobiales bacterium]|nr:YibE/F family protein [Acidimicrobiales bacterium]